MSGNRHRAILASAVLVGGAMLMTACQDTDSGAAQDSSSTSQSGDAVTGSDSATDSAQGSGKESAGQGSAGKSSGTQGTAAAGSGSSGNGSAGNGKLGRCATDQLKITAIDNTISGDPDGTVAVTLKNVGGQECVMSGYAGVDLKTNAGTISAERTGQKPDPGTLKSGESVSFAISYPFNKTGGTGVRITGLLVTPPNETKTVTLNWPGARSLPVTDGSGAPVKVGPIGSAGQGG
ncbi:DUF4232 domain-containing protein [Streptomyces sp. NPDC090052]|uniref:DUF4232 domain-containing protein n=1 Tax=unclassified Streptomyces TaxID=2593676 RepID=UPI0022515ABD|nr:MULTISPECIES: DUF4232 domain-containing protein [unclassified Streptomyces]MCX4724301.1 DUF4232 domain-containing protein [Streptomyces sp. NBC_01306]WSV06173.1 DUF4232 domain-containing protein [Streptomyces sp. NBC_01020]WSX67691.1 DUF4232 domain-containing protein [Streptomyces sp. NBC_00932]